MPKLRRFIIFWLPVILWMAVIFSASRDQLSSERSSRLIAPVLRWLFPDLPDETVGQCVFWIRKAAHVFEYAVLSILLWRALHRPGPGKGVSWRWSEAGMALGVSVLYAATDELHQHFVPGRQGSAVDVLIDGAGALLGLTLVWLAVRWRNRVGGANALTAGQARRKPTSRIEARGISPSDDGF